MAGTTPGAKRTHKSTAGLTLRSSSHRPRWSRYISSFAYCRRRIEVTHGSAFFFPQPSCAGCSDDQDAALREVACRPFIAGLDG